jgi:guanylate kinase
LSKKHGNLFVIAAPSGAGKTSLVKAILGIEPGVQVAVSHTTRQRRPEEMSGVNYFFVSEQEFHRMRREDQFIESANVFGNLYGTSKAEVNRILNSNQNLILEIDWQGAIQIRQSQTTAIGIFILPPSVESLRNRLLQRAQDDSETIEQRMSAAMDEMSHYHEFDYLVINDDFDTALMEIHDILHDKGETLRTGIQSQRYASLITELLPTT